MNVFFDHQAFSLHTYGGVSRYFSELISGINQTTNHHAHLPILFSNNTHLKEIGFDVNNFFQRYDFRRKKRMIYELNRFYTLPALKNKPFDILHPTYFDSYFIPYQKKKPLVVTFHDMIHEKFSQQYPILMLDRGILERKRQLAHKADRIIAVSESTKRDIVDILAIEPEKIEVIYHGCSLQSAHQNDTDEVSPVTEPYLLFVGTRWIYKNFGGLLASIHAVLKQHKLKLICAGGGTFTDEELTLIQSFGLADFVEHRQINDQSLKVLYRHAVAFVFPSLYEGFGLPILEAFQCNCPCIINDCSSLPEVAGDAALYVDFNGPDSLTDAVEQLLFNSSFRENLIEKGQHRLSQFSWQNTVDHTLKLYESLV